jgi:hypothetical protein
MRTRSAAFGGLRSPPPLPTELRRAQDDADDADDADDDADEERWGLRATLAEWTSRR